MSPCERKLLDQISLGDSFTPTEKMSVDEIQHLIEIVSLEINENRRRWKRGVATYQKLIEIKQKKRKKKICRK